MLIQAPITFDSHLAAKRALTNVRRQRRIALRGAVVTGPDFFGRFYVHVKLGGTGFSAGEIASELHALRD